MAAEPLAEQLAAAGRYAELEALYDAKESLSALDLHNRGFARYRQVEFPGALRDLTAALEAHAPEAAEARAATLATRGQVMYRLGMYSEAAADFRAALALDEAAPDAAEFLAAAEAELAATGDVQRMEEFLRGV